MKNILFITDETQRYYWEPFVEASRWNDVCIHTFDTSNFPRSSVISLSMGECGQIGGSIEVESFEHEGRKKTNLNLNEIDTAWYLRPGGPRSGSAMTELEARFTREEAKYALKALFNSLDCNWVNRMGAIERAESSKFYQQSLAAQCGLIVPQTLITNDSKRAIEFSEQANGLLIKTLGYTKLGEEDDHFIYSQRFATQELSNATAAIKACPIFCQQYIEKRYEYRIMAIGKQILACRIDSQASSATKVDWRHYDFDNVEHRQIKLPDTVQKKLLKFMKVAKLQYGAIDMIETTTGEFVFLEINPSGQWQWLQHYADLHIPEAVAKMLTTL